MAKNNKSLDLCRSCAEDMKAALPLVQVGTGVNQKITCVNCGRRRYGAAYKIDKKAGKNQ